jgi:uncharacterized protein YjcR
MAILLRREPTTIYKWKQGDGWEVKAGWQKSPICEKKKKNAPKLYLSEVTCAA